MHRWISLELYLVLWGWALFAIFFLLRSRTPRPEAARRDRRSLFGMGLQWLGFAVVWSFRRADDDPGGGMELLRAALVIAILVVSLGLTYSAVRRLGKQWSLSAQVVAEHELITTGPYAWVRHPIYAGMFGMLLATGLAVSAIPAVAIGAAINVTGTVLRMRVEERLLRQAFGERYDDYARRVPALLPRRPRAS